MLQHFIYPSYFVSYSAASNNRVIRDNSVVPCFTHFCNWGSRSSQWRSGHTAAPRTPRDTHTPPVSCHTPPPSNQLGRSYTLQHKGAPIMCLLRRDVYVYKQHWTVSLVLIEHHSILVFQVSNIMENMEHLYFITQLIFYLVF